MSPAAALPSPGSALMGFTYSFYWSLPPIHTSLSLAHFPHQLEFQLTVRAHWALPIHTDNFAPVAISPSFRNVTRCSAAPSCPLMRSLSDSCLWVRATEISARGWVFGGLGMIHPPSKSSFPGGFTARFLQWEAEYLAGGPHPVPCLCLSLVQQAAPLLYHHPSKRWHGTHLPRAVSIAWGFFSLLVPQTQGN